MRTLQVGDVTIQKVVEAEAPTYPVGILLPSLPEDAVARHRSWLEPAHLDPVSGLLVLSFHSFVVRTPKHLIVVDTCMGNDKDRPDFPDMHRRQGAYLAALGAAGVEPHQVDYVLCTHLHVDHVGWNTRLIDGRWVPTFPRAAYVFARTEYRHWLDYAEGRVADPYPGDVGRVLRASFEDSVRPVVDAGQVKLVDDGYALDDWCTVEPAPGHTPGNVIVVVRSRGAKAVLAGDTMHHPLQVYHPQVSSGFCYDPARSAATRLALIEKEADADTILLPAHFANPTAGRIESTAQGFRFAFHH